MNRKGMCLGLTWAHELWWLTFLISMWISPASIVFLPNLAKMHVHIFSSASFFPNLSKVAGAVSPSWSLFDECKSLQWTRFYEFQLQITWSNLFYSPSSHHINHLHRGIGVAVWARLDSQSDKKLCNKRSASAIHSKTEEQVKSRREVS